MCGIFGVYSRSSPDECRAALQLALGSLAHRGPDGHGTALTTAGDVTVAFAQTRLAILDLSPSGHQPMHGPDGEVLVFNGEIYNHRELRPALEAAGVVFEGNSDTETLLHLLIREGAAALDRLVGMFAFAFWDPRARQLMLARDRLGKKPLYWVETREGVVFASEVRTLLATGAAARELDRDGLARWLSRGSAQDPTTLVRGVRSLQPGHIMTIDASGRRERRYWSMEIAEPPPDWRDQLESLLDTAVRQRLLSDRPIGVFLSGGVDSSAIAAVAARHAPDALESFTLTFDEVAWNEGDGARAMAARLGLRHHTSHLTAAEALSHMEDALAAQDLPSHDGFNTWFVTRAARQYGLVVALAGTGGDELFGGYLHFRRFAAMMRVGAMTKVLPEVVRSALSRGLHPAMPTRWHKALALAGSSGRPEAVYAVVREMFPPIVASQLLRERVPNSGQYARPTLSQASAETQLSLLELSGYLVDTQLRDIDAMSMAHGFEVRSPLLDHRLVQAVLAIPSDLKAPSQGINKRLLVDIAGLPHDLFRRPKRGFVIPWDDWLRGPLANWIDSHLAPDLIAETGALDPKAVSSLVRTFNRHGGIMASRILSLVALSAWCRRHGVRSSS